MKGCMNAWGMEQRMNDRSIETADKRNAETDIIRRKREHIEICLREDVEGWGEGTGFDRYRFRHLALPELDFAEIRLDGFFLGRGLKAPFFVSSMTGGTDEAGRINVRLAEAAQRRGWAMGLGSLRAAIEAPDSAASFQVRSVAPDVPLLANLGAVQLNCGYGIDECRRAVDLTGADALVLHLNGMQEVFQDGGNTDFRGLLRRISALCKEAEFPVGVKEVGMGIDGETVRTLAELGVSFVDVAGAGGTSWIKVEKYRTKDRLRRKAADAFEEWGNPTAECVREAREAAPDTTLIASGGAASGVDAAKALALGADAVGFGRALLAPALDSAEALDELFARIEFELRAAMFGIGAGSLSELRGTRRLVRREGNG